MARLAGKFARTGAGRLGPDQIGLLALPGAGNTPFPALLSLPGQSPEELMHYPRRRRPHLHVR